MVPAMSASELLELFLVLGTAKIAFLVFLFLGPAHPGVVALAPPQAPSSITIQVPADTFRVQSVRAAPASRATRTAQEHHDASGAAGPPPTILQAGESPLAFPAFFVRVSPCIGLAPRAPPA
jgi:hypothetical protein